MFTAETNEGKLYNAANFGDNIVYGTSSITLMARRAPYIDGQDSQRRVSECQPIRDHFSSGVKSRCLQAGFRNTVNPLAPSAESSSKDMNTNEVAGDGCRS